MNNRALKQIYRKTKSRNLQFSHVCEVGVYLPETSNIVDYIKEGTRATLVEADPETVLKIRDYFKNDQVTLHPVAVWDTPGTLQLSKAAASTFATDLKVSPAIVNDNYNTAAASTFTVPCKVFSEIDDGTIDLMSVDIEGGEWYVIKHMKSLPKVISVETHGKYYTNPFIGEISQWMSDRGYIVWFKDASDTVFVQQALLTPSLADKIGTSLSELKITWKKLKRAVRGR
ncbi:MAG: FkbM family methyltransferase [Cyclobacteriaceae bacterium]|nr:FkbM family methyltransferase [Cyclobacteriaceae bacterium]